MHSYIVGTETKKNKKERKETIERDAKKRIQHSTRGRGRPIKLPKNISLWVVGFLAYYPIQNFFGGGDSLYSVADRYTYTISVPNMYHIVGREWVDALWAESWKEAWEAHHQEQAARAAEKKKKQAEEREKAKREFDSVGGTPFNGVRAIAKRHNVAIACLKRYADRNAKCRHDSDTDSSALVAYSGPDDSWDGDSDTTM